MCEIGARRYYQPTATEKGRRDDDARPGRCRLESLEPHFAVQASVAALWGYYQGGERD